jgi:hypothetical protein
VGEKKEYIERGAFIADIQERLCKPCKEEKRDYHGIACRACWVDDMRMEIEDATAADLVSKGVYEQVKWERDMAMQQLEEHGIPFCGVADDVVNVVRCKDCRFYGNEERHPYGGECEWFGALVERNNFCFYGERKEQT